MPSPSLPCIDMSAATRALSYLASLNPLHRQDRREATSSVTPVTDSDTSCSSTSARDSIDGEQLESRISTHDGVDPKERERQQYDERVQGFRLAEYPALRGTCLSHP